MALTGGTRLGSYEIIESVGAGGMGEVYKARDTKLDRDVAIKVLPQAFAENKERLARFEREAKLLASLNHPNIATLFDLQEHEGTHFLVQELVPGETLAESIKRRPIPLDEALPIFKQIAEGLEAAHEKGVVHRDLKPANIKVTREGEVRVLDFGLAKAFTGEAPGQDLSQSPTFTRDATQAGVLLGTAPYMSPEQARGKAVDRGADIWAFGVVVFEMLTGKRLFLGETVSDTLAAVLKTEPEWSSLPADTPAPVRRLLRRCLEKDRKKRLRSAADACLEIDEVLSGASIEAESAPALSQSRWKRVLPWVVAGVLAVISVLSLGWGLRKGGGSIQGNPMRLTMDLRPEVKTISAAQAISPDGRYLALFNQSDQRIWIRNVDSPAARALPGTEGGWSFFWSPDSRFLGFLTNEELKVIDVSGGPPRTLAYHGRYPFGGTWSREGEILFSVADQAIQRVSPEGGEPVPVSESAPTEGAAYCFPRFLPDGRHFLYGYVDMDGTQEVYIGSLDSKSWKKHVMSAKMAEYVEPGYLVFERQGAVLAQVFDASRIELLGEPVVLVEATEQTFDLTGYSVSRDALVYLEPIEYQLTWYDRSGNLLGLVGDPGRYWHIELSPEGDRVAVERIEEIGTGDIWIIDLRRGTPSRVTSWPSWEFQPLWSPDGRSIAFSSNPKITTDIFETSSAGSGEFRPLLETSGTQVPTDWSRDGRYLLYANSESSSNWLFDLSVLPLSGGDEPKSFLSTEFSEQDGRFSPDGRWVAYASDESGRLEVYVRPFPPSEGKWRISLDGGHYPLWRGDGKELYFLSLDGKVMAVQVKGETAFDSGQPQELFSLRLGTGAERYPYAVTTDGQRFLVRNAVDDASPVKVIVNWMAELEQ